MPLEAVKYLKAYERDASLRKFCETWILSAKTGDLEIEYWAPIASMVDEHPDLALMYSVSLVELADSEVGNMDLSMGFEFLLANRGSEYIDVVCELSRLLPRLPQILCYIWGSHLTKPVLRKLELFRSP